MFSSQTIIGDILPYTQAIASGGQTVFMTNWTANYATDVVVFYTPSGTPPSDATQQLTSSQFSVAFIGALQQVQVTLVNPANLNDIVTITRLTPAARMNLYNNSNFLPQMLNQDFGILTLVDQQAQLVNQLIAPRYNYSAEITDVVDTILPILGPNQVWMKNAGDTAIIAATIGAAGSGNVNPGLVNELAWYSASGTSVSGLPTGNNGVLVTNNIGEPSISSTLPAGLTIPGYANAPVNTNITSMTGLTGYLEYPLGVKDTSGNKIVIFGSTPNAVNYIQFTNNATGLPPVINAFGSDTNIDLNIGGQGTGAVNIRGASTNSNAPSGYAEEFIFSAINFASAVSISSNTPTDITHISLTAGDWDVWGNVFLSSSNSSMQLAYGWISSTSATIPDLSLVSGMQATAIFGQYSPSVPSLRFSLASTTNIYLSADIVYTGGTGSGCGGIYARRRR